MPNRRLPIGHSLFPRRTLRLCGEYLDGFLGRRPTQIIADEEPEKTP